MIGRTFPDRELVTACENDSPGASLWSAGIPPGFHGMHPIRVTTLFENSFLKLFSTTLGIELQRNKGS